MVDLDDAVVVAASAAAAEVAEVADVADDVAAVADKTSKSEVLPEVMEDENLADVEDTKPEAFDMAFGSTFVVASVGYHTFAYRAHPSAANGLTLASWTAESDS